MTMVTLAQMRTSFESILSTVTGVDGTTTLTVYKYMPSAVPDEDCPALILIPGPAVYDQEGEGAHTVIVTRDWTLRLVAQQEGIGDEYDAEVAFDNMLSPVIERLASYQRVPVTETPDLRRDFDLYFTGSGDEGVSSVPLPGGSHVYAGTDISCTTRIEEVITPLWR